VSLRKPGVPLSLSVGVPSTSEELQRHARTGGAAPHGLVGRTHTQKERIDRETLVPGEERLSQVAVTLLRPPLTWWRDVVVVWCANRIGIVGNLFVGGESQARGAASIGHQGLHQHKRVAVHLGNDVLFRHGDFQVSPRGTGGQTEQCE